MSNADWAALAGSLAVAVATLVLAFFTWRMARATKDTVKHAETEEGLTREALQVSRDTLAQAKEDSKATLQAVSEARRQADEVVKARIDATAPRVTVLPDTPEWPPYLDKPWITQPQRAEPGTQYSLPGQAGIRLWFRTRLLLHNEGTTTAVVSMHGGNEPDAMRFVDNRGTQHGNQTCPEPRTISQGRYALEPGEYAVVLLDTESTVGALAASNDVTMSGEIIVTDQHEDGIIDNTIVQVHVHAFDAAPGVTAVYHSAPCPRGSWGVRPL